MQPQATHQHYKGGLYQMLMVARRESDKSPMVVYRALIDGSVWIRPLDDFERKFVPISKADCP